jgi:hypothetical protein
MKFAAIWKRLLGQSPSTKRTRMRLTSLDERITPTINVASIYAVGSGPGMDATVKVYNSAGTLIDTFLPYPVGTGQFQGGVEVAIGDINGDGVPDVITGAGSGGGPHVKVFNGVDVAAGSANPGVLRSFFAYDATFVGGVHVAAGDINGDGQIDIITGAGPGGGPHVEAFSNGNQGTRLMSYFAYEPTVTSGVFVAAGDVGGDGTTDEIITGAGPGSGSRVGVYNYLSTIAVGLPQQKIADFFAYDPTIPCGVTVASGFTSNNRDASNFLYSDIITGASVGGGPHVKVFRLLDAQYDAQGNPSNWQFFTAGQMFPYSPTFTGGIHVEVVRNGTFDDILTAPGAGMAPDLRILNQTSINDLTTYVPTQRLQQFPFPNSNTNGINL